MSLTNILQLELQDNAVIATNNAAANTGNQNATWSGLAFAADDFVVANIAAGSSLKLVDISNKTISKGDCIKFYFNIKFPPHDIVEARYYIKIPLSVLGIKAPKDLMEVKATGITPSNNVGIGANAMVKTFHHDQLTNMNFHTTTNSLVGELPAHSRLRVALANGGILTLFIAHKG